MSAGNNDVPPWQEHHVFCESPDVGFMEEIAAPAPISQEITLPSNWILTHSFLLLLAINMCQTLTT